MGRKGLIIRGEGLGGRGWRGGREFCIIRNLGDRS